MGLQASRVGPLPRELQEDVLRWESGGAAGHGGVGLSGGPVPGQALVGCVCVCACARAWGGGAVSSIHLWGAAVPPRFDSLPR